MPVDITLDEVCKSFEKLMKSFGIQTVNWIGWKLSSPAPAAAFPCSMPTATWLLDMRIKYMSLIQADPSPDQGQPRRFEIMATLHLRQQTI